MTSPPPALFVREHVQAPENRLNLALFALLNVAAFQAWFLRHLHLPDGSVVYPPQNVAGGRPDLVAVQPGGGVLCWIEVELGPPDLAQLNAYRSTLAEPVWCIAGTATDDGDVVQLSEIADAVRQIQPRLVAQQRLSAQVLLDLIGLLADKSAAWNYADPGDRLKREPLIAALVERLPDQIIFGVPPLPPGKILLSTITQKGWTLRVHSRASKTDRSFSVMWNQAVGRGVVRVPSQAWLSRYLPNGDAAMEYAGFLARAFEVDVSSLRARQSASVPKLGLLERVDDFATVLGAMSRAG